MNGLDLVKKALQLWRENRGNESTYLQCQRFDGFYVQSAWAGNWDAQAYPSAQAAANAAGSRIYTTDYNNPEITAGEKVYWSWPPYGHVGTVVGRDSGGLLVSHTANGGDTVLSLSNNVKISHAHTVPLALIGISSRDGQNAHITGVDMWLPDAPSGEPANVAGGQRTAGAAGVKRRAQPTTQSESLDNPLGAGDVGNFNGWINGESVDGNSVWFRGISGNWFWSGGFVEGANTAGLENLNSSAPVTPPVTPKPQPTLDQAYKSYKVDSPLATWVGSPNYNYRDPRPAGQAPKHVTLHWMSGTLEGTDAQFQKYDTIINGRGDGSASTYGVGPNAIHQYVREQDYQQADGNADSNRWGLSIEHEMSATSPIAASTIENSAKLMADIAKRYGWKKYVWMENVFPHKHWVSTQCPGTLPTDAIIKRANELLTPIVVEPKPDDDNVTVSRSLLKSVYDSLKKALGL